jgi:hypothetical protein
MVASFRPMVAVLELILLLVVLGPAVSLTASLLTLLLRLDVADACDIDVGREAQGLWCW